MIARTLKFGAKRYPPYGGLATAPDWRAHYGDALLRRFREAKRKYNPADILTPGPGIFTYGRCGVDAQKRKSRCPD